MPEKHRCAVHDLLINVVVICLAAAAGYGQHSTLANRHKLLRERQAEHSKALLDHLQKHVYRARRDIRAVDCITVQDGRIIEWHTHGRSEKRRKVLLRAGTVTQVSKVEVTDSAIQVYFEVDTCSVIAVSSVPLDTASMTMPQLLETARKAIGALFETIGSVPKKPGDQATGGP